MRLNTDVRVVSSGTPTGERTHLAPLSGRYGLTVVPTTRTDWTLLPTACVGKQITTD